MVLKEVSYAHQGCIYIFDQKYSKNTVFVNNTE